MKSARLERLVLVVAVLATTMAFVDSTALNVALPALQRDLRVTGAQLLWIINAYAIPVTACVLVTGALGDRLGLKRVFTWGILGFALGSLFCGLAADPTQLMLARVLQGLGAAAMIPGSLALLTQFFPVQRRGKVVGIWSALTVITMALGPAIGGWLASRGWWRYVFFLNLPISAVCLWLLTQIPETNKDKSGAVDVAGALTAVISLVSLSYGLIEGSQDRWSHPDILAALVVGCLTGFAFVLIEKRTRQPMLPLALFRSRTFSGANLITLFLYTAFHGAMVFVPLHLIQLEGYSADAAGLSLVPVMLMVIVFSPVAGKLTDRFGPRWLLIGGQLLGCLAFFLLMLNGSGLPPNYWSRFLPAFLLLGAGMGLTIAPLSTTIMSSVGLAHTGVGSGINSMLSRLASVLAISLLGGCALLVFRSTLASELVAISFTSRQAVMAEADRFGDARVPDGVAGPDASVARRALMASLQTAFRSVYGVAASLALFGAATGWVLIPAGTLPSAAGGSRQD